MSSKKAGLPSLNSANSKKGALQPVLVKRYRAGQAPEGYVDPALESSEDEDQESNQVGSRAGARSIQMSIGLNQPEAPKAAYQVLNVEKMTQERELERKSAGSRIRGDVQDRRLQRLQATGSGQPQMGSGDRRRRRAENSDSESSDNADANNDDSDEDEAMSRRRKAAKAKAQRGSDEEEELWGQGEEEEEDDQDRNARRTRHGHEGEGNLEESSEYTSGSEESSSEDEMAARRRLMKPVFVPKSQRVTIDESSRAKAAEELAEQKRIEEIESRKRESHLLLQEYMTKSSAENVPDVNDNLVEVDDTDGLDEAAEFEEWKLRELRRIKRDRLELEEREAEKIEIERRRELTEEERVKEDMAYLAKKAKEEKDTKTGGSVEKYHHKGAFFMDTDEAILKRSTNEPTPDAVRDIKSLPKVMQVRHFGRAGQTKYTTLKDQDTSRPSGWNDPSMRHIQSKHRAGGMSSEDVRLAQKYSHRGAFGGVARAGRGDHRGDRREGQNHHDRDYHEDNVGRSPRFGTGSNEEPASKRRRQYPE